MRPSPNSGPPMQGSFFEGNTIRIGFRKRFKYEQHVPKHVRMRPFHTKRQPTSTQHTTCEPDAPIPWVTLTQVTQSKPVLGDRGSSRHARQAAHHTTVCTRAFTLRHQTGPAPPPQPTRDTFDHCLTTVWPLFGHWCRNPRAQTVWPSPNDSDLGLQPDASIGKRTKRVPVGRLDLQNLAATPTAQNP